MRQVMLAAAERYGGEYDGWEAAIQPTCLPLIPPGTARVGA
jgi:hypothetical protein